MSRSWPYHCICCAAKVEPFEDKSSQRSCVSPAKGEKSVVMVKRSDSCCAEPFFELCLELDFLVSVDDTRGVLTKRTKFIRRA